MKIERPMRWTGLKELRARAPKEIMVVTKETIVAKGSRMVVSLDMVVSIRSLREHSTTGNTSLARLYKTFRTMTSIEHTEQALPENEYFCVSLKVKQRYINPLVVVECPQSGYIETTSTTGKAVRLSEVSSKARTIIEDFKSYSDTAYGCVKLL